MHRHRKSKEPADKNGGGLNKNGSRQERACVRKACCRRQLVHVLQICTPSRQLRLSSDNRIISVYPLSRRRLRIAKIIFICWSCVLQALLVFLSLPPQSPPVPCLLYHILFLSTAIVLYFSRRCFNLSFAALCLLFFARSCAVQLLQSA